MKNYILLLPLFLLWGCSNKQQTDTSKTFSFEMNFSYPGDPVFVYDHLTGDISDWWDHSFSEKPYKLFIEARPGGGFYEIFDESGDGVKHATVIFAQRGHMLRMEYSNDTPEIVRQVWEHFLWEQFQPYIEEHYRHR